MTAYVTRSLLLGFLLVTCGCGAPEATDKLSVVKASGTLTIPDMEVNELSLLFVPEDKSLTNSWCRVNSDGTFDVSTYDPGDGASVGKYKVLISDGVGVMPGEDPRLAKIPAKYQSQTETTWEVEVTTDPKNNVFNLKVE